MKRPKPNEIEEGHAWSAEVSGVLAGRAGMEATKGILESALAHLRCAGDEPPTEDAELVERFVAGELTFEEFHDRCDQPFRSALQLVFNHSDPQKVHAVEKLLARTAAKGECQYETRAFGPFRLVLLEQNNFVLAPKQPARSHWGMLAGGSNYSGMRDYLIEHFDSLGPI